MRLFRFLRRKADLTEEIESHLKMAIADRVASGQSPADARTSAMREFGSVPMIADSTREQWGWLQLELLVQDIRYNFQNDNGDFDLFSYDLYLHLKQSAPVFEQNRESWLFLDEKATWVLCPLV
jgi:hypothetical protein